MLENGSVNGSLTEKLRSDDDAMIDIVVHIDTRMFSLRALQRSSIEIGVKKERGHLGEIRRLIRDYFISSRRLVDLNDKLVIYAFKFLDERGSEIPMDQENNFFACKRLYKTRDCKYHVRIMVEGSIKRRHTWTGLHEAPKNTKKRNRRRRTDIDVHLRVNEVEEPNEAHASLSGNSAHRLESTGQLKSGKST